MQEALATTSNRSLVYTYDFGGDWRHRLSADLTNGPLLGLLYPRLIEAAGRCPSEGVGGPSGYAHFLEALADHRHPNHQEFTEWHNGPFDPLVPDIDLHQLEILKLAKRWKPRTQ
ncbi:plasmid pRiA4b ORF-3 family protein [Paracoccus sp. MC1854]|uniref:plasmid pRiA4b ORF-3 family protein n=1 Tax=Paracoccus sp. MC1854 TaxID=2760306 RepID=UPI001C719CD1|nr:plasmid pRiA4b ORF-3 family protein [Paracoccus sp. MC1854]